jgi:hypothetical protein
VVHEYESAVAGLDEWIEVVHEYDSAVVGLDEWIEAVHAGEYSKGEDD